MPAIIFGSRNTMGAIIMPATAPIKAAIPQPSANIQDTRIPTKRADSGLNAAARIARPSGVKRKKQNTESSTTSVTEIDPIWWPEKYCAKNIPSTGNGLGNDLIVCSKIHPAKALKITSKPTNTITLVRIGAFSTGLRKIR